MFWGSYSKFWIAVRYRPPPSPNWRLVFTSPPKPPKNDLDLKCACLHIRVDTILESTAFTGLTCGVFFTHYRHLYSAHWFRLRIRILWNILNSHHIWLTNSTNMEFWIFVSLQLSSSNWVLQTYTFMANLQTRTFTLPSELPRFCLCATKLI